MKRKILLLALPMLMAITGCGGNSNLSEVSSSQPVVQESSSSEQIKYTVRFDGTSLSNLTVNAGDSISKPSDPQKDGYIFGGWYLDSSYQNEAQFPLKITSDTVVYARFNSYKDAFKKAREKTIGKDVAGYEFDYETTATATVATKAIQGNMVGNTKYSATGDVRFYDEHVNSGILFNDGTVTQTRTGTSLAKASFDENNQLVNYSVTDVPETYNFDSSNYAKALFEMDDESLKNVKKTNNPNEYLLETSFTASKAISIIGNHLNSPIVEKLIGELPETDVQTGMLVTFSNGCIQTYKYIMNINVSKVSFNLTYSLRFKNVGKTPTITPKAIVNAAVTNTEITKMTNEVKAVINSYKEKGHSSYAFKAKTGVDHGITSSEINSTFSGNTMRKRTASDVFFWTEVECDSDYKNADLYKEQGIVDYKYKRTKLNTGEVYEFKKGKLLYDDGTAVTERADDDYYLLDVLDSISSFSFVSKVVNETMVTYNFGLNNTSIGDVMTWMNQSLRLNPYETATYTPMIFGSFNSSSINVKKGNLVVTIDNGELNKIELSSNGKYETQFASSVDFTEIKQTSYDLSLTLTPNSDGETFEPAATAAAAKKL
jgi:hypothetical protein